MVGAELLYLLSLVIYTFGALTFSVLAVSWLVWGRRTAPVLAAFTAACAVAFVANLLLWAASIHAPGARWLNLLEGAASLATALLPPLLFHLIWRQEQIGLPHPGIWKAALFGIYAISVAGAMARTAAEELAERLDWLPAMALGLVGALGLAALSLTTRDARPHERRQRWWYRLLLAFTLIASIFGLSQAADYLLLAFFAVTLYYRERLAFFDVWIRQGAFFLLALVTLTVFFATTPPVLERLPDDWLRPWIFALLLTPLWLSAPWLHRQLTRFIDHFWLGRPYTPAEAERQFTQDVQNASDVEELRTSAVASLSRIFQTSAMVVLEATAPAQCPEEGLLAPLEANSATTGWLLLQPRPNALPFLSDDQRLLQSLARTLGVVLENVRFRQERRMQEEREQQLRLLASRAELRALRAQINPHFLFNALNAIAGLIPGNPALADETVEKLAQVFRYTLRKSEREWATFDDEIEFAQAYLCIEQARFGDRLRVEIDVPRAAHTIPIPAMTIQPLLENAVKHGVGNHEGPAIVALRASLHDSHLSVEVFDNGPGFPQEMPPPSSNAGHGLRNVTERLHGYYGDSARLWWQNCTDGTRVFLSIPKEGPGTDESSHRR